MYKKIGKQSVAFKDPVRILTSGTVVGKNEGEGPLSNFFDVVVKDDMWGTDSFEKCERKMYEQAVRIAVQKSGLELNGVDYLLGGDLLNQITTASYAARELEIPFLGLYGACSTMAESSLLGAMIIDGGFANTVACAASSNFAAAERQYRMPLELGGQDTPTTQRTVTGAGSLILTCGNNKTTRKERPQILEHVYITHGTIGKVVDFGISDANNMGAAMAPAAMDTLLRHFEDTGRTVDDYDLIITGDLGSFGSEMLINLCKGRGVDIESKHIDCGNVIYSKELNIPCGGSGCGCSGVVVGGYLLKRLDACDYSRCFFMATGALLSPTVNMQGESIASVAHGVSIERLVI